MVLLGFTVVYALSFMGLVTYFYEMQLQYPDSFTMFRSVLIFSLDSVGWGVSQSPISRCQFLSAMPLVLAL